jgi:putative ABC transport system permease protein
MWYAARRLAGNRSFTAVSILTPALGIGASTAIFSVIDGVLLKPLPYPQSGQLVALLHTAPGVNIKSARPGDVAGVVADLRDDGIDQKSPTIVYRPILEKNAGGSNPIRTLVYIIRTPRAGSSGLPQEIQDAVPSINPNLPLADVKTLQSVYERSFARTSLTLMLLAIAGSMALLLGVVGIYGVISYSVSQRTKEVGIRLALGAPLEGITGLFVRHGLRLSGIGAICGLASALALTRLMKSLLFEVSPADPLTYGVTSAALVVAAVLGSYLPARRATRVDPVEALRAE